MSASEETCSVPGCGVRAHARSLCRPHYDRRRYEETTRRTPGAVREDAREAAIRAELDSGSVPGWASRDGTESMFASDRERREAWEARREGLMARRVRPPYVASRPWAFWRYEAGREQHLIDLEDVLDFRGTEDEEAAALDEFETEPVVWLAENGHLAEYEVGRIRAKAEEASPRVGTDAERIGSAGVDRADRRRVALWEAVREAIG